MFAAITAAFAAVPAFYNLFEILIGAISSLATTYQTHVKLLWAQSLQSGLQPLEGGQPTTDAQKMAAAQVVATAIAKMNS